MRSGLPCTILAAVAEHEREAISAVAPFTGVRIETSWRAITRSSSAVAPFTGRGSKPTTFTVARSRSWSLPSRGRGSKHFVREHVDGAIQGRSLHGGADRNVAGGVRVPSTSSRSLHGGADRNSMERAYRQRKAQVAPFTGARIETFAQLVPPIIAKSLPSRGRGSKRCRRRLGTEHLESLPSRGRGSKQHGARIPAAQSAGRSLHGGADRNPIAQLITASTLVAPFTGGSPLAPRGEWWQRLVPTQRQDPPRSNE
jgi:hypothetical protein